MINYDNKIFNINIPTGPPEVGKLLIAEPFLKEDYFHHAAIMLVDYKNGSEAMGLVMNRLTSYSLHDVLESVNDTVQIPLFCGGPMSTNRLFYIHSLGSIIPDSKQIGNNLFVGGDFDAVLNYLNSGYPTECVIRFFLGYSGWSPYQLQEEIENNVWAVMSVSNSKEILSGSEDAYWHRCVRQLGKEYKGWRYHPRNPHAN